MKATLLDTKTGLTAVVEGVDAWGWAEGNWSCDCNRNEWGVDTGKQKGVCEGCERFIVVEAEMEGGEGGYSLADLNSGYPDDLLRKHGIDPIRRPWRPSIASLRPQG